VILIVSGTVQTPPDVDPDSLWITTNKKIAKFAGHNCHWTVPIDGLEKGTTVITAQSRIAGGIKGNPS